MAFSTALRRAASVAGPLVSRTVVCRQNNGSGILRAVALRGILSRNLGDGVIPPPCTPLAYFSTLPAEKPASDSNLLKVLDDEIKCAAECDDHDRVEEIPERFPFAMKDEQGMNVLTLKRKYQNEEIEIVVQMPSLVTGRDPENRQNVDDDGDDGDGGNERPGQSSMPLTVSVAKEDGPILEFSCTAYPDDLQIDSMSVRENKQNDEEMLIYEGPDFNDLDENLQKGFHKYLELRGISAMTTNFLQLYMINKDSREYLLWLKNLKNFIQK